MRDIETLRELSRREIAGSADTEALEAQRVRFLGKKGDVTALLRSLGSLPSE